MNDPQTLEKIESKTLDFSISWTEAESKFADIDISVVAIDKHGVEMGAVFYNEKSLFKNAVFHSGDRQGHGSGSNETISINLRKVPRLCKCLFLMINLHNKATFSDIDSANFSLKGTDFEKSLMLRDFGAYNAMCPGIIVRDDHHGWNFRFTKNVGHGKNFEEAKSVYETHFALIFNQEMLSARPADRNKNYNLQKGTQYVVDPEIKHTKIGLGWDPKKGSELQIDVDASVILYSPSMELVDVVYYSNKKYKNYVSHTGDNVTGQGKGDDEQINIFWDEIDPKEVSTLAVILNIFSGTNYFSDVQNCFCRLMDESGKQLCKFNLSDTYNSNGILMVQFRQERDSDGGYFWAMQTLGEECRGKTAHDCVDLVRDIIDKASDRPFKDVEKINKNDGNIVSEGEAPNPNKGCCLIL